MKKIFSILMSAAMLLLASCTQDDLSNLPLGQEMSTKVSMQLPPMQRAAHKDPAVDEDSPLRVFLIVSHNDQVVDVQTVTTFAKTVNFDVRLVTGQAYDLMAWADFGENYYTVEDAVVGASAPSVSMVLPTNGESLEGSDNKRDAYYAIKNDYSLTQSGVINMTLKRPFGLINIKTLDYTEPAVANTGLLPTHYATTITMPTKFNLVSGETIGDAQAVNISAPVLSDWSNSPTGELSYDYIFASNNKELIDFTMNYTKNGAELVNYDFKDIPLQRNYKTNISGNILTKQGTVEIEISQMWDGEYAEQLQVLPTQLQATVDQLPNMEDDKVVLNVASAIEDGNLTNNTLTLPRTEAGDEKELVLIIPGINAPSLTINDADGANYTGKLTLYITAGTTPNLIIDLPNATVEILEGAYTELAATTADNTLIIGEDASVATLTVNGGNVKIYGEVASVEEAAGYTGTVTYNIATVAQLRKMAERLDADAEYYDEKTVVLENDLDLANENWTAIGGKGKRFSGTFDGNGKTIRNLKIAGQTSDNACGLFGCVSGVVKNFTIDGAEIEHVVDGTNGGIAVVAGSLFPSGQVENVTVKNAVLNGNRQMGGIAGSVYGSIRNCTVENITLTAVPDQLKGNYDNGDKVGGIVGLSATDNGGEISGNTVKNVIIKGYRDLGGIAGAANGSDLIGNTASNITIRVDQFTGNYGEEAANAGVVLGRNLDASAMGAGNNEQGINTVGMYVPAGQNPAFKENTTYYLQEGTHNAMSIGVAGVQIIGEDADKVNVNGSIEVIADNVAIKNLTINSTSGDAIYTVTSNITLNVEGVKVLKTGGTTCIRVSNAAGVTLNVKDCNLVITKKSMRGINFYDLVEGEKCYANVENTHIGPREETMGYGDYTDEQNAVFKGLSDTRGIGVAGNPCGMEINMNNSVVEGIYYAVNLHPATTSQLDMNVVNSTLDGRCAFNIWSVNENGTNRFYVKNSKLVGRNPFDGPTESFATIMFNFGGESFNEPKNNHVIVEDSEIYCYNNPETPTNEQLAADMRSWDTNTLELKGNTVIYDRSASSRLEYAVELASSDNTCNVDPTVRFVDRNGSPKNKPIVMP